MASEQQDNKSYIKLNIKFKYNARLIHYLQQQYYLTQQQYSLSNQNFAKTDDINIKIENYIIRNRKIINYRYKNNKHGYTALFFAVTNNRYDIAALLVKHGADLNLRYNIVGDTLLILAVNNKNLDLVRFLVDNGANTNLANFSGRTALTLALKLEAETYPSPLSSIYRAISWTLHEHHCVNTDKKLHHNRNTGADYSSCKKIDHSSTYEHTKKHRKKKKKSRRWHIDLYFIYRRV